MNIDKFKVDIQFAINHKYSIKIHYTDEIDYSKNNVTWKYPPYIVKNCITEKIISEIENYFKNSNDYLIVMYFEGNDIVHKIPINLPV
tara:strand:- start:4538 stop:4801 length:264 start_codon:yes stop_codon:yes gene_type:complete